MFAPVGLRRRRRRGVLPSIAMSVSCTEPRSLAGQRRSRASTWSADSAPSTRKNAVSLEDPTRPVCGSQEKPSVRNCACERLRAKAARSRCPRITSQKVANTINATMPATGYASAWRRRNSGKLRPSSSRLPIARTGVVQRTGACVATSAQAVDSCSARSCWQAPLTSAFTQSCFGRSCGW